MRDAAFPALPRTKTYVSPALVEREGEEPSAEGEEIQKVEESKVGRATQQHDKGRALCSGAVRRVRRAWACGRDSVYDASCLWCSSFFSVY